jgi:hypothetical protein
VGIAVYVGADTKIMRNLRQVRPHTHPSLPLPAAWKAPVPASEVVLMCMHAAVRQTRIKFSTLERRVNLFVMAVFIFNVVVWFVSLLLRSASHCTLLRLCAPGLT